ncbi:MAG TPA: hypothetical protein VFM18_07850 [Methanosarcina sp.]|nr:hypothetical protein [Methanosarcina sp.]
MRVVRPIALAMVSAMEKNKSHPVAKSVQAKANIDSNFGIKNTYGLRINAPKSLKLRDFQV